MAVRNRRPSPLLATAEGLIGEAKATLVTAASRFRHSFEVAVDAIVSDPAQPRQRFPETEIVGLAATMAEQGQLQPILVRRDPEGEGRKGSRWVIVAGERRWRAARHNGWATLLAIEIGGEAGGDPEVATLVENLQRSDLSAVEEARGIRRLIETRGWTQDEAAVALGRSKAEISAILRILSLPSSVLDAVLTSELALPRNALVELARLPPTSRDALLARARRMPKGEGLTVQEIRAARRQSAGLGNAHPLDNPSDMPSGPVAEKQVAHSFDRRALDRATAQIEAAAEADLVFDEAVWEALERLRAAVDTLLGAARHKRHLA
jgi:ParB family transcriptional regulator, chromosome partitioning protein